MSERQGGDGNTDASKVDTEYGERSSTGNEGSGPRRVSEVREERASSRDSGAIGSSPDSNTHRSTDTDRDADRGTSWVSVVLGWLAALGAGLILSGIVGGIVGAILGTGSAKQSATEGGSAGLIGVSFIDQLSGVTLPGLPQDAPQSLGTIATVAGILALLVPFIGGAIGGAW